MSQQAIQDLLNNPPGAKASNPQFNGRDWRTVEVGEIVDRDQVRFVETSTSVEDATNVCFLFPNQSPLLTAKQLLTTSGPPNVVLLRERPDSHTAIGTFDYSDLNAYLLLVVGIAQPDEKQATTFKELAQKGREGKPIPMKDVKDLGRKEPLVFLPHTAPLTKAVEIFGSGIHRTVIVKENTTQVVGILTQLRLVQFFWDNGRHFSSIEPLYPRTLRELDIGSHTILAIK